MDIKKAIEQFLGGSGPDERYASFDYCYNYFYSFYRNKRIKELANDKNIQMSCLQLGFYLASWGMMRGKAFISRKSVRNYKKLINTISQMDSKLWEIDVNNYTNENINLLLKCKEEISNSFKVMGNNPSDTLITKIMLGVFANIPAFDQYFKHSFGVNSVNKDALEKINIFYESNKGILDSTKIYSFDFLTGEKNDIIYTKAKLIDMCGFSDGQPKDNQEEKSFIK